ncbi:MAG TPA: AarF/UbiB family protein [Kofleriaceae bacterium]|nr:AarF/UbiB family protein [Kofleriaceae bacterium]
MFWYWLLGVLGSLLVLSLVIPTTRRIWAFHFYAFKYLLFWFLDVIRLRPLWFKITGRRYVKMTRPLAMRLFAEDMGPTFLKFGQIVASSSGMFPDRYVKEFQKCLDRVRPFGFDEVQQIIREELGEEKARELTSIEPKPLASASIAQVHTAELSDGTRVVIKVQRPGIQQRIAADMRIMRTAAVVATKLVRDAELANPVGIVEDFSATLHEELDFRLEAQNLDRFNEIMAELGHKNICAPVPHWDYTTGRVLVMERFFGNRVDEVEAIHARGIDAEGALVQGLRGWFQCVIFYGFFHGDVHAGNLMLLENDDLGFLDFGIVGRFDDEQRRLVTDYIIAFATGDYRRLAEVIVEMGGVPEGLDLARFISDLEDTYKPILSKAFSELNYAELLPGIQRVATRHRMIMPKEFVLITKQMLYFDRYAKLLAPKLNIFNDPRLIMSLMADIQKARAQQEARAAAGASSAGVL